MKKHILLFSLFVCLLSLGCKKHKTVPGIMQATANGDSLITTDISAVRQTVGTFVITAVKASTSQKITLVLWNYEGGGNYIFSNQANYPGYENGNSAMYQDSSYISYALVGGYITITNGGAAGSTSGNFYFQTTFNQTVAGSFTVANP